MKATVDGAAVFAIAIEGECDPRREPARGARLDSLLNGLSDGQLDAIRVACRRLEEAAVCAQIRNYGLPPTPAVAQRSAATSCPRCHQPVTPNTDGTLPGHQITPGPKRGPMCRFRGVVQIGAGT